MANHGDEVIDLTNSFTLVNHYALSDAVIEVLDTDESLILSPIKSPILPSKNEKSKIPRYKKVQTKKNVTANKNDEHKKFGECPICYESLGKNPLSATICGHVFCKQCLKQCLKVDRKCPTCRCALKGSSSHHPLYF